MRMAKSIIQSFSLDITEAATLTQAEEKAREQGKSFSKYLVHLIKEDLEKNEQASLGMPILSKDYQSAITEYMPILYKNDVEKDQLFRYIETCKTEDLTQLAIQVNETRKEIEKRRAISLKPKPFRFGFNQ